MRNFHLTTGNDPFDTIQSVLMYCNERTTLDELIEVIPENEASILEDALVILLARLDRAHALGLDSVEFSPHMQRIFQLIEKRKLRAECSVAEGFTFS